MRITGPDDFRIMYVDADGPLIRTTDDALDLIGATWGENITLIAVPADRLDPEFWQLRSQLAGDVLQKFVNYEKKVAILGDIEAHLEASQALRDFVWESNRGEHVWFLPDEEALEQRIVSGRK